MDNLWDNPVACEIIQHIWSTGIHCPSELKYLLTDKSHEEIQLEEVESTIDDLVKNNILERVNEDPGQGITYKPNQRPVRISSQFL